MRIILYISVALLVHNILSGYPTYHDPKLEGEINEGYCSTCHPGFKGGKNDITHALHTGGSDPVTGDCGLCHVQQGDLPVIMYSDQGLGCMGCHGRDYGETIKGNYEGHTIVGLPKNSGVGLRKRHNVMTGNQCAGCHPGDPEPYPENVIDPGLGNTVHYYFLVDNKGDPVASLGGKPLDPSNNEDSANDADPTGLDNDGDFLYDMADADSVTNPSEVFIAQLSNGDLQLTWPTPSPNWIIQKSATLGNDWVDLPAPAATDRENGLWMVTLPAPLDPKAFYRATDTPAAAAALSASVPISYSAATTTEPVKPNGKKTKRLKK